MVDGLQPVQDPFGFSRLAQSIRANRAEQQQRGLQAQQQQLLGLQIQGQQQGLADMAQQRQMQDELLNVIQQNPDKDPDFVSLQFLSQRDPERARELHGKIFSQAERLMETAGARAATDFVNKKTGSTYEFIDGGLTDTKTQKTGAFLVRNQETGEDAIATGVFNPSTGKLETATAPLEGFNIIDKLGETPSEKTERKITQKRGETRAGEEEKRAGALIDRGIEAAETTATIRRAIELLDSVKTGGVAAASLAAKRFIGVEGADEGELSNSLGKAVLSQLRETFGAAFTENEGLRLARIEADFGKSSANNKRLLSQSLRIAERSAKRARAAALKRGDMEAVEDIDDLLSFSLSVEKEDGKPKNEDVTRVVNTDLQGNIIP